MKALSSWCFFPRLLAGVVLLVGLFACSSADEPTPTGTSPGTASAPSTTEVSVPTPTPTAIFVPAAPVLNTPTPTPIPGVVAVPTATSTPPPEGEKPKYGGTLRFASGSFPTRDAVIRSGSSWAQSGINANFWSQLIRLNPTDRVTVEGDLAESWTISADGLEWKFKIRPGVVDHDGNPYTVDDAYWQMIRYVEKPNGMATHRTGCIRSYVKKIWDENKQPLPNGGAEITGTDELTIRLMAPGAGFVACFASGFTVFQPDTYTKPIDTDPSGETRDLDETKGEYVGTGPFQYDDLQVDTFIYLKRFDNFFREGLPYLDALHFFDMQDQSTWEAAFSVGRLDFVGNSVGPSSISVETKDRMQQQMGDTVTFPRVLAMGRKILDVNTRRAPFGPMGDPTADNLRTAVQIAVDRGEINDLVFEGLGHLATEYFVGWDWIYSQDEWVELFPGYDFDPVVKAQQIAKAQALVKEAGYGPDNRLEIQIMTSTRGSDAETAQVIARQLRDIYMDVTVVGLAERMEPRLKGDFDLATDSIGAPFPDPDAFNTSMHFLREDDGRNDSGTKNQKFYDLHFEQALLKTNAERAPILREMAKIFHEDATAIGWLRPTVLQGYRTYVNGHVPPPYHFIAYPFENVWLSQ